jgi:poly(3-hydroxybutyrate) depolymerase
MTARFCSICFWIVLFALPVRAQTLTGQVIDKVICEADPSQAYALYVPSGYTDQKKWPVIFCFDAGARGLMPVERLRDAAEKYGYIVAGSLNSRNGPWSANAAAANAMVKDVTAHFAVDGQRIYTAGMSGGARVATSIAMSGLVKGVIACGAGFPQQASGLPKQVSFVFFGIAGTEDFNYPELRRLDGELEEKKVPHRIVAFEGGHVWAPAAVLTEAVEWLELQAIRTGTRPKDEAFIQTFLQKRLAAVPEQPVVERWRALKSIAADFAGLADTTSCETNVAELAASRELKEGLKAERALEKREDDLLEQVGNAALASSGRKKSLAAELRRKSDAPEDSPERRMVRRVIASCVSMTRETVRGFFDQGDYEAAQSFLEFAVTLKPDHKGNLFELARARALNGDKKRALDALEQAVVAGYNDASRVDAEPAFAKLRSDPRFQAAAVKIRAASTEPTLLLPVVRVSAALASVELRLFYLPNAGGATMPLSFLRVETVRSNSLAAGAGLEEGMEITSIQGIRIRGLTETELNDLMAKPVKDEILLIARPPGGKEKEIRVPLKKPTPVASAGARSGE